MKPFEDRALIETVVNTAFERGYYQSIRVVSVGGETLADKELPAAQGDVPVWFTRLFPLHPPSAEALISAGWRQLGRVLVTSHPNFAYLQLWHTGVQTLALLLLVYALTLIALRVFLANLLRPLRAIERAATAIAERDFSAITLKPKARELGRVVAAMNSLSAKIRFVIEDESARAQTLQREAYRDPVTGLLNRRGLEHDLEGLLHAERDVFSGVFVLLELERFKEYNLRRGYQRADELLALIAQAITGACASQTAICSRIGGASFALCEINIDANAAEVLAALLTSRVEAAIAEQALTEEIEFHCGAVHFDAGAPSLPELLAAADLALTRAQQKGSNTFDLIALIELDWGARGSLAWRKEIEDAIDNDKLALYTQTVLSLPAGAPMQSEIFTRIRRRQRQRPARRTIPADGGPPQSDAAARLPRAGDADRQNRRRCEPCAGDCRQHFGANRGRCRLLPPPDRTPAGPARYRRAPGGRNDRVRRDSGSRAQPRFRHRTPPPGRAIRDRPFQPAPRFAQATAPTAAALHQTRAGVYERAGAKP